MSELILGVGQAQKLEHAFRRNEYSTSEIDRLSEGDLLGRVRQVILGRAEIVLVPPKLLELVTTVEVEGTEQFIAADHFVVGRAGVAWLGDNFKKLFLGKVETNVQPATIRIHRLKEASLDTPIRAELGADREEIALAHFWAVPLNRLPVGSWVIAYIRGTDGDLWAVHAHRLSDGWSVDAPSVTHPRSWRAGPQVFSR